MYKLSIIIPIYNVEEYLAECLESVLIQDSKDIEVIMVNDCSTDSSREIAIAYKDKFNNAKFVEHSKNKGLGPARNTAMDTAQGDYMMMLDSDDWLDSSAIEKILDCIHNSTFDVAQFGCNKVSSEKTENNLYLTPNNDTLTLTEQKALLLMQPNYAWLKVVRSKFTKEHNHRFQNIFYEDIPWSIGITLSAEKIIFCPITICNYRQREGSIIYTQSPKHLDLLSAYNLAFNKLANLNVEPALKRSLNNSFIKSSYYLYRQRHARLGGDFIDQFTETYFTILADHRIYPVSIRALAMFAITLAKITARKIVG